MVKTVTEYKTDLGGNTTVEYSDGSTNKFNITDAVTAQVNPVTGWIEYSPDNFNYARSGQARPGNLTVFLGDSITAGADSIADEARGPAWPVYASIMSGQRIQYARNAGVAGNTTAQMLARFDTDVTPYAPQAVMLLCGTNDTGVITFDAWKATYLAILDKIRSIGAVPILCTMPPNNATSPTNRKQAIGQFNGYIKLLAAQRGLILLDFYSILVDPATSNYKAAYYNDGTHPNDAGNAALGTYAAATLANLLPPSPLQLCADDVDNNNTLSNGCFTAFSGTTLPTGWADQAGTPGGSVVSYVTDSAVPGQLLTITQTATALREVAQACYMGQTTLTNSTLAGATSLVIPVRADYGGVLFIGSGATFEVAKILSSTGGGPQTETLTRPLLYAHAAGEPIIINGIPGDTMIFSGVVTKDAGVTASVKATTTGGAYSPKPMSVIASAITRGVFYQRFVIPAGTTMINWGFQAAAGTGVVAFGRVGVYNATRLGI